MIRVLKEGLPAKKKREESQSYHIKQMRMKIQKNDTQKNEVLFRSI